MLMKVILAISAVSLFLFQSCKNEQKLKDIESPLTAVIKMHSAEQLLEFEEAKKYVDVNKIYKDPTNDSMTAEDVWKSMLVSENNLSNSRKFTNQFKYFNYDITELITGANAEVIFKSKSENASIQSIIYQLVLGKDNWIVNSIEYKKRE